MAHCQRGRRTDPRQADGNAQRSRRPGQVQQLYEYPRCRYSSLLQPMGRVEEPISSPSQRTSMVRRVATSAIPMVISSRSGKANRSSLTGNARLERCRFLEEVSTRADHEFARLSCATLRLVSSHGARTWDSQDRTTSLIRSRYHARITLAQVIMAVAWRGQRPSTSKVEPNSPHCKRRSASPGS